MKKTPDYDNVFKTMKMKHKRLFISVINDIFHRNYPTNAKVEVLPSEGYITENETEDGSRKIEEQISDFLIRIGGEIYLLECQSYDDGSAKPGHSLRSTLLGSVMTTDSTSPLLMRSSWGSSGMTSSSRWGVPEAVAEYGPVPLLLPAFTATW